MSRYTVAVVGTGPDPDNPTVESFAMGYRHAEAYRNHPDCELVACADIVPENAAAFAEEFGIDEGNVFEDYEAMAEAVEPDLVSVTVPPDIHERVVVDLAETGVVDAVHCEKPMADTLAAAERMVDTCDELGVQLTFNRQRRFGKPFTEAKRLLEEGAVGDLQRVEIAWGDFFDTGAHTIDLTGMFNDDVPAEWVIAQLDYREEDLRFGVHQENQMWAQWRYENGVYGVMSTGEGGDFLDCAMSLRGSDGEIRIDVEGGPMLELRAGGDERVVDVDGENMHTTGEEEGRFGSRFHDRAVADVVESLDSGEESRLSGRIGLQTARVIFGGYESVRRRGRVDLPAAVEGNPFLDLVESGELSPEPADEQ